MIREIILDTETTGLNPSDGHRIVEIAAVEMINKVLTGKKIHFYNNPERLMPEEAMRIHGLSSEFLQDKPLFKEVVDEVMAFIGTSLIVAHNAPFDLKFINYELSRLKMAPIAESQIIDTLPMARKRFPGSRVNLDALCKKYKIDNSSRVKHTAILDATLLAKIYVELSGGRQEKLEIDNKDKSKIHNAADKVAIAHNLIVLSPNAEEILAHQKLLDMIPNNFWPKS